MKITLLGEPKSTSHIYKYTCRTGYISGYMSEDGKTIKESYKWQAKSQWRKRPTKMNIEMSIDLFFGTKRKQDIDNFSKLSLDSLSGIVYEDDSQIQRLSIEKNYDKKNPRIEIEIFELE